jgi:hypothetical protein
MRDKKNGKRLEGEGKVEADKGQLKQDEQSGNLMGMMKGHVKHAKRRERACRAPNRAWTR